MASALGPDSCTHATLEAHKAGVLNSRCRRVCATRCQIRRLRVPTVAGRFQSIARPHPRRLAMNGVACGRREHPESAFTGCLQDWTSELGHQRRALVRRLCRCPATSLGTRVTTPLSEHRLTPRCPMPRGSRTWGGLLFLITRQRRHSLGPSCQVRRHLRARRARRSA